MKKPVKVVNALLDAVWVMRWNKDKTALSAVLDPSEAQKIVDDIFDELDSIDYEIKKKPKKLNKVG